VNAVVADMVWPFLYLEEKLLTVAAVGVGLVVEILALRFALGVGWRRAISTGVCMNAVSALVGVGLIPVCGALWEVMWEALGGRYGAAASWAGMLPLAAAANAIVELPLACSLGRVPFKFRVIGWLFAANMVSVGVAFALVLSNPRTQP
jgi:hypothetical protein